MQASTLQRRLSSSSATIFLLLALSGCSLFGTSRPEPPPYPTPSQNAAYQPAWTTGSLGKVLPGFAPAVTADAVWVATADGTVRRYTISDVRQAPKTDLDRAALFATGGPPRLVLVTCGGEFDPVTRSFASNTVVTALPV